VKARKEGEKNMSAFMVEDKTINNVVNWLQRDIDRLSFIPCKLNELGIDTTVLGWQEILGHELFQLNIAAVDARYGSGEAVTFRKLDYCYQVIESVPLVQVLKSLQCWLYQCCEGDVSETELYKLFAIDIQMYLMSKIIDTLPEYQDAEWG
jgi:hypothetical protein